MLEIRDHAFRLFGMTIPITGDMKTNLVCDFDESSSYSNDHPLEKDLAEDDSTETGVDYQPDDSRDQSPHSESDENQKDPNTEKETESPKNSNDSKNSHQKSDLKKPDKILPCPRCKSMDTKFCYYNNYNVNQPRYFCKSCQRYWTAGGTMRNVPVGAGRRKNKSSPSQYYHITMSESQTNGSYPGLKTDGMVLTFGYDNHSCEPLSSETKESNVNGVKKTNSQQNNKRDSNGFVNQVMPCLQWPYVWNPTAVPVPAFPPSGYPIPFYPAPYWNVPCVTSFSPLSDPGSHLGKHSRDGKMLKPCDNEESSGTNKNVLVPKTLRIDDPNEAAMSSIWTTLGIKKDTKGNPLSKGGLFNCFNSAKGDDKDQKMNNSQSWTMNPAALCRSINFQESALR